MTVRTLVRPTTVFERRIKLRSHKKKIRSADRTFCSGAPLLPPMDHVDPPFRFDPMDITERPAHKRAVQDEWGWHTNDTARPREEHIRDERSPLLLLLPTDCLQIIASLAIGRHTCSRFLAGGAVERGRYWFTCTNFKALLRLRLVCRKLARVMALLVHTVQPIMFVPAINPRAAHACEQFPRVLCLTADYSNRPPVLERAISTYSSRIAARYGNDNHIYIPRGPIHYRNFRRCIASRRFPDGSVHARIPAHPGIFRYMLRMADVIIIDRGDGADPNCVVPTTNAPIRARQIFIPAVDHQTLVDCLFRVFTHNPTGVDIYCGDVTQMIARMLVVVFGAAHVFALNPPDFPTFMLGVRQARASYSRATNSASPTLFNAVPNGF
jgi:hypothetical protein